MNKEIALIIVHFGRDNIIYHCLRSIERDFSSNQKIIIVSNISNNLMFEENDEILIVTADKNRGYAAACNMGIHKAIELGIHNFILCNNDVQFSEDFFSYFLPRVIEIECPIIVAPKINFLEKPDSVWYAGGRINMFKMEGTHITHTQKNDFIETEFISGCCFYLSQYAFEILGPMDENFFLYDEDLDYSLRANEKGVRLLVDPTVTIHHNESSSTREYSKIGKYRSEIYFHKLRSKILITRGHAMFPYTFFIWGFIFYKFVKYAALFFIRGEFNHIIKLSGMLKNT